MRWTLWLILLLLCGIYEKLIGLVEYSVMIVVVLSISGIMLFKDYFKKRR